MEEFTLNQLLTTDYQGCSSYPLESWHPQLSGDIDIRIDTQGRWWHEGSLIKRGRLCSLFARLLIKEGEDYFIITPVEKWRIQVEDRPFIVNDINDNGSSADLIATIGYLGDVTITPEQWDLSSSFGELRPELDLGHGLSARLARNLFYRLAEGAVETEQGIGWSSSIGWLPLG